MPRHLAESDAKKAEEILRQEYPDCHVEAIAGYTGYDGQSRVVLLNAFDKGGRLRLVAVVKFHPESTRLKREHENCQYLRKRLQDQAGKVPPLFLVESRPFVVGDTFEALLFPAANTAYGNLAQLAEELGELLCRPGGWSCDQVVHDLYHDLDLCLHKPVQKFCPTPLKDHFEEWFDPATIRTLESRLKGICDPVLPGNDDTIRLGTLTLVNPASALPQMLELPLSLYLTRVVCDLNLGNILVVNRRQPVLIDFEKARLRAVDLFPKAIDFAKLEADIVCHLTQGWAPADLARLWFAWPPRCIVGSGVSQLLDASPGRGRAANIGDIVAHIREKARRLLPQCSLDTYDFRDYLAVLFFCSYRLLALVPPGERDAQRKMKLTATSAALAASYVLRPEMLEPDAVYPAGSADRAKLVSFAENTHFDLPVSLEVEFRGRKELRIHLGFHHSHLGMQCAPGQPRFVGCSWAQLRVEVHNGKMATAKPPDFGALNAEGIECHSSAHKFVYQLSSLQSSTPLLGMVTIRLPLKRSPHGDATVTVTVTPEYCLVNHSGTSFERPLPELNRNPLENWYR